MSSKKYQSFEITVCRRSLKWFNLCDGSSITFGDSGKNLGFCRVWRIVQFRLSKLWRLREIDFWMTVRHLNLLIKGDHVENLCKNMVLIEVNFFFLFGAVMSNLFRFRQIIMLYECYKLIKRIVLFQFKKISVLFF